MLDDIGNRWYCNMVCCGVVLFMRATAASASAIDMNYLNGDSNWARSIKTIMQVGDALNNSILKCFISLQGK